jgi:SAM-dependent methyltransferase
MVRSKQDAPRGCATRTVFRRPFLQSKRFLLHVDHPPTGEIAYPFCVVDGWFAWPSGSPQPGLKLSNADVTWAPVQRPDVKQALRGHTSQGFRALLDASQLAADGAARLELQLSLSGGIVARQELRLNPEAVYESKLAEAHRRQKREWLREHVACPICARDTGVIEFLQGRMRCRQCGAVYPDNGAVLDFLPENLRHRFRIEDAEDISAHQYDRVALDIVEDARRAGGKVLDCGSGMRPRVEEAVICLEVAPFPAVDVLAVNQRLPFRSAVFDAVLSLNVLEHVTDPFACAAELVRVLKPGGRLYCCIPFLQPEHGYPHHYFNATRSGLRQLFPENFEVLQHVVPGSGEPIWSLHWFLSWYAAGLPEPKRQQFLQLRVKDIIGKPPGSILDQPWVGDLSEQTKWKLASTTAAVFRKPS